MEFETMAVPDGELFRRVWGRVMPDQSLSPVVVREQPAQPMKMDYIAELEGVLEGQRQWLRRLEGLSRQSGGKTGLKTLWEGELRQQRRLEGVYFLLTASRHHPQRGGNWGSEPLFDSLRRGFFLEMEWADCYGRLSQSLPQIGLQEAAEELRGGALEQGRKLRNLVERQG